MSAAAEEGLRTASLRSLAFELPHRADCRDSTNLEGADLLDFAEICITDLQQAMFQES